MRTPSEDAANVRLLGDLLGKRGWAPVWSRVLEAGIVVKKDAGVVVPPLYAGWNSYTLDEVERLTAGGHSPEGMRYIHLVKSVFDGTVI